MNEKCNLVIGRFQGVTKAHVDLLHQSFVDTNHWLWSPESERVRIPTYVGIVVGKKSSKNKIINPFTFIERVNMLRRVFPELRCVKLPTAFIGDILEIFHGLSHNINMVYIGSDRKGIYEKQLKEPKYFLPFKWYEVKVKVRERKDNISATDLRKALLNEDEKIFKKMSPVELWREFQNLCKLYKERINNEKMSTTK